MIQNVQSVQGVKVFTASMHRERDALGEQVTHWLKNNAQRVELVDMTVAQSSDSEFHCLTIVVFYRFVQAQASARAA